MEQDTYKLPNSTTEPAKVEMEGDVTVVGHPNVLLSVPRKITVNLEVEYDERDGSRTILVNGRQAVHIMAVSTDLDSPEGYDLVEYIEPEPGLKYGLYALWTIKEGDTP